MNQQSMARPYRWLLERTVSLLAAFRVHPYLLTCLSLLFYTWAGVFFAFGRFAAAGATTIAAGLCDSLDGPLARRQGRHTLFFGFFESILHRYADLVLFLGVLVYYAGVNRFLYAVLAGTAMAGAVLVSYAQARAESLVTNCQVGFWERPERIVLMILGAFTNRMPLALWVLAIGPNITVVHRIIHTWRETEGRRRAAEHAAKPPAKAMHNLRRLFTRGVPPGG